MNILIIIGHPLKGSYNHALAKAFVAGASKKSNTVKTLDVSELNLNLLMEGYKKEVHVSEAVAQAQELVSWANHLVLVYPIWWSTMPALLKSFFEQVFVSGFAFTYQHSTKVVKWDKHLTGKSAQVISTMDAPPWYYKYFAGDPGYGTVKGILKFCGVKLKGRTYFGSVKMSTEAQRKNWLAKAEKLGSKLSG